VRGDVAHTLVRAPRGSPNQPRSRGRWPVTSSTSSKPLATWSAHPTPTMPGETGQREQFAGARDRTFGITLHNVDYRRY
jgi:hypothetical protein